MKKLLMVHNMYERQLKIEEWTNFFEILKGEEEKLLVVP